MHCIIVSFPPMILLQTHTCICIDNRCVDKKKRYAFYKMTMRSPQSQNKTDNAVI